LDLLRNELLARGPRRSSSDREIVYAQSETMDSPETLADIAIFAAVVREGSFTRAADKLELSTSQVSKCVSRLERTLGARLLQRTTRRLRLTEAGSALYENSSSALAAIEDAKLAVSKLQGAPRGKLKVGSSTAFGAMQLPRIVRDLNAKYPELEIELVLEDRHVDLVREGIDVAIRVTGDAPDSGLVYRRLGPNRQVICASPEYIALRGLPRALEDLDRHDCIAHSARSTPRLWHLIGPDGEQISAPINGRPTINSALAVRQAALEGLGIIELNSYLVGDDIVAGRLVRLLPQYRPKELHFYAIYAERRFLAPKIRVFVDAMIARIAPEPPWDAFLSLPGKTRTARTPPSIAGDGTSRPGYARKSRPGSRGRRH
jgi:DNA-binding transcriptional LysR family regulator